MKTTTENTFPKASVMRFADKIEYADGGVVSKQVLKNDAGNITLFAFDEEQGLAEHTAPFDALVQVLDGEAEIRIGGEPLRLKTGDAVIMPAGVPHALQAVGRFKMLLTMIKGGERENAGLRRRSLCARKMRAEKTVNVQNKTVYPKSSACAIGRALVTCSRTNPLPAAADRNDWHSTA
mgnify:CR=1 FL=1